MAVEYLDPRAEPGRPIAPYGLRITAGEPVVLALLANGFPDSVKFLDEVETALGPLAMPLRVRRYAKSNASVPAEDQLLDGIAAECSATVTAYGH